jgi:hypothetical protein
LKAIIVQDLVIKIEKDFVENATLLQVVQPQVVLQGNEMHVGHLLP